MGVAVSVRSIVYDEGRGRGGALGRDTLGCLFFFNDGDACVVVETSSNNTYLFM